MSVVVAGSLMFWVACLFDVLSFNISCLLYRYDLYA